MSRYATEAVAGLGIVKKLDQLPLYFSIGVSNGPASASGVQSFVRKPGAQEKLFPAGMRGFLAFSLLCLVVYEILAPSLALLFIKDPLTVEYSAGFLRRMVTAMPLMSVCYPLIIQFQAMGKFRESMVCSVLRKGVLDIPLLFIMNGLFGLYGCMWVQPMVDAVSLAAAGIFYQNMRGGRGCPDVLPVIE